MIAKTGGWAAFARKYPATIQPDGVLFRAQSLRIGRARYTNVLNFVISPTGLYMEPQWLFRFGHQPILLPWREIQKITFVELLWIRTAQLDVGNPVVATLQVRPKVLEATKEFLGSKIPVIS